MYIILRNYCNPDGNLCFGVTPFTSIRSLIKAYCDRECLDEKSTFLYEARSQKMLDKDYQIGQYGFGENTLILVRGSPRNL